MPTAHGRKIQEINTLMKLRNWKRSQNKEEKYKALLANKTAMLQGIYKEKC